MPVEEEIAKTAGKVASATEKALDLVRDAGRWIGTLVEPGAGALSEMFADQARYWRAKNLNRIAMNYARIEAERPFHPAAKRLLPFGDAYLALGAAAEEESPVLQEMWARLLFNATRPDTATTIQKHYVELLRQLSEVDALLLQAFEEWTHLPNQSQYYWDFAKLTPDQENYTTSYWEPLRIAGARRGTIALNNALRLRLLAPSIGVPSGVSGFHSSRYLGSMMDDGADRAGRALQEFSDEVVRALQDLQQSAHGILELEDTADLKSSCSTLRSLMNSYDLTPLGSDFLEACSTVD